MALLPHAKHIDTNGDSYDQNHALAEPVRPPGRVVRYANCARRNGEL